MTDDGLGSWPGRRAARSPDRVALVFGADRWTYAQLHDRSARLAARFRSAGIRPGDRIAYLGPNHPAFVETMFAAFALGAIFVPLNFRLTAPEVGYQLGHCGAAALVYAPECAAVARAAGAGAATVVALGPPGPGEPHYDTWLAGGRPEAAGADVGRNDPACILYTSGTTGRPKGAVLTHGNIIANCVNVLVGTDLAGDEVTLIGAPLFHVAALNQGLLPTLLKGGRSVIMPSWDAEACLDLIAEHRVTWMVGVPAMFAALARSPRWHTADLSSVRSLLVGGAPVPAALIRTYQDRGLVVCQGYGMTETAPGVTYLEARDSVRKAGSAGVPVFLTDVRCVRPDLTDTAPGEPGEIVVRGPTVTPGYWNDPVATAAAFTEGWFRTGDLATVDADGHFRLVDRATDMFVSGGENVYPAEVEAAIAEHPDVAQVAVVGVPDGRWGEVGRAFVVAAPGRTLSPGDVRDALAGRLARYKIPVYVDVVGELPRTASDKVRKSVLRQLPITPG